MRRPRAFASDLLAATRVLVARVSLWDSLSAARIIQQFRDTGATTPAAARPFRASTRLEEAVFIQLLERAVIREPQPGCYYLDEATAASFRGPFAHLFDA